MTPHLFIPVVAADIAFPFTEVQVMNKINAGIVPCRTRVTVDLLHRFNLEIDPLAVRKSFLPTVVFHPAVFHHQRLHAPRERSACPGLPLRSRRPEKKRARHTSGRKGGRR